MRLAMVLLAVFGLSGARSEEAAKEISSTRSSYEVTEDGDPLKIDEDGRFWEKLSGRSENGHRSFHSDPGFNRPDGDDEDDRHKLSLKEFLETYAKKHNKKPVYYDEDTTQNLDKLIQDGDKDKSKSTWTLLDVQRHKHPYDDRKGWVSLDPIPWSLSKISKWQSKYKPTADRPWDDDHRPIDSQRPYDVQDDNLYFNRPVSITPPSPYVYHRPTESSDRYDTYSEHRRPTPTPSPTVHARPTAYFGHKIHVDTRFPSNSYSSTGKPYLYHNQKDCDHPNHPYDEIITDGLPSNFPQVNSYDALRRRGTEMDIHSEGHPFKGEGEWILLSTTKGYKPPRNKQRSLSSSGEPTQSLRASRGVRLTVLPPLKGSNVNMTTSHGGLLQVESTFESVEEAKQNFDKKQQHVLKIKGKKKRRKTSKKNVGEATKRGASPFNDPGAVMAAVGAGMIPATMAMMVPIAMSGG